MKKIYSLLFLLCFQFSVGQNEIQEAESKTEDTIQLVENVPVYPGCENGDNQVKKKCMSNAIQKHIEKKFRTQLAEELDLPGGNYTIYAMFKVDKKGDIVEIKARAPHIKLKEETIRVIGLLPKLHAGITQGKPVTVPFAIPIYLKVEDSKEERKEKRRLKRLARKLLKKKG